mmetsp:Transcript_128451/g.357583  ORF Transcript_128451/g.357583 Transcript_128451/m.357583 type:complete len:253 (-) Transcript_128451:1352-2110(-)
MHEERREAEFLRDDDRGDEIHQHATLHGPWVPTLPREAPEAGCRALAPLQVLLTRPSPNGVGELGPVLCRESLVLLIPLLPDLWPEVLVLVFLFFAVAHLISEVRVEEGLEVNQGLLVGVVGAPREGRLAAVVHSAHLDLREPLAPLRLLLLRLVLVLLAALCPLDTPVHVHLLLAPDVQDVAESELATAKVIARLVVIVPDFYPDHVPIPKLALLDLLLLFPLAPSQLHWETHWKVEALVEDRPDCLLYDT